MFNFSENKTSFDTSNLLTVSIDKLDLKLNKEYFEIIMRCLNTNINLDD
jgi:hypothetical protein